MGYLTKYGSFWGFIPQTQGRIFWVAPAASYTVEGRSYSSSDNQDGLSPEQAFRTVDYAIGQCTANAGDVIVLLTGAHSVSATVAVDVAGITITGIPSGVPASQARSSGGGTLNRTTITTTETSGIIFTVTVADVEIAYLHLIPIAAGAGISISNAGDRAYVHDCTFRIGAVDSTAQFGVNFPLGTGTTTVNDDSVVRNCYFLATANVGPAVRAVGTVLGLTIENSTFDLRSSTAWDDAIELTLEGNRDILIRDCDFLTQSGATVITDCIDVTGMTTDKTVNVFRCYFPEGSDAIEASGTLDVACAENYLATSTGGALTGSI